MQSPESYPGRAIAVNQVLLASAARTATSTGSTPVEKILAGFKVLFFQLDVTAAATAAGDKIDVYVQTTLDGTKWVDIVHFTQILGNGGVKLFRTKVNADVATAEFENGAALGAAAVRNIVGDQYRCRWVVTSADAPSFTFSVVANAT